MKQKIISIILAISAVLTVISPISFVASATTSYEQELINMGFPTSYVDSLVALHNEHPKWTFTPLITGIPFSTAVQNERKTHSQQLIQKTSTNDNKNYYCTDCYENGDYIIQEKPNWVSASQSAVEHYMDPRASNDGGINTFLDEYSIYQFEVISYNSGQTTTGIESIIANTWMKNANITYKDTNGNTVTYKDSNGNTVKYSTAILNAAKKSGLSAYYLASKIVQEVGGTSNTATGVSGTNSTYPGIYNYYNIKASSNATDGLAWASAKDSSYGRAWTNPYTSIYYGAIWIAENYPSTKNTGYFQKFNVNPASTDQYKNEYMANVQAANNESFSVRKAYIASNTVDAAKTFIIPVYSNMPDDTSTKYNSLSNGNYKITSSLDSSLSLNIDSNDNGAKLALSNSVSDANFSLTYNSSTCSYTIKNSASGKVLDVPSASKDIKTKVQQYTSNGTSAQEWVLVSAGSGYYYIVSRCNGLYLDIPSASAENGKELQLYTGNRSDAQKFKIEQVINCDEVVSSGTYKISTAINSSMIMKINSGNSANKAKLQTGTSNNAYFQNFELKYNSNSKTYTILNSVTGKALDVPSASTSIKTELQQYTSNGTKAQQWVLKDAGNGYYYIESVCNGLYIDIPGGTADNNENLWLYTGNSSNAQKFKFTKAEELQCSNVVADGTYTVTTSLNSKKALDISGASKDNKANLQLYDSNGTNAQKFVFKYDSSTKSYIITSKNSGKALDVSSGSKENKANVQQYTSNNTKAQRWVLTKNSDGSYTIYSQGSGLCLDVASAKTDNKTNIWTYESNGSKAQKFKLS